MFYHLTAMYFSLPRFTVAFSSIHFALRKIAVSGNYSGNICVVIVNPV